MLRKINKKAIVALIVAVAIVTTLAVSVSANFVKCVHNKQAVYAHVWASNTVQAAAEIESHSNCTVVRVTTSILLSNGTWVYPSKSGDYDAGVVYYPPSGVRVIRASGTIKICDKTITFLDIVSLNI